VIAGLSCQLWSAGYFKRVWLDQAVNEALVQHLTRVSASMVRSVVYACFLADSSLPYKYYIILIAPCLLLIKETLLYFINTPFQLFHVRLCSHLRNRFPGEVFLFLHPRFTLTSVGATNEYLQGLLSRTIAPQKYG
jgi:hypothetical protein